MTSVVIVHSDPRSTIRMLRAAGFVVEVAGDLENYGFPDGQGSSHRANVRRGWDLPGPPARTVLLVSEAAEVAA